MVALLTMLGAGLLSAPSVLAQATPAPAGYVIHELPTLGGDAGSVVEVNDAGVAVGWSELRPGEDEAHATLWVGGEAIDLGALGGDDSLAVDINDAGVVVGYAETASGERHAVIWRDEVITDLGTLGGENSSANAVNESGVVVGQSQTASGEDHAFLWQDGEMRDLGTLGGVTSEALHITDDGVAYGTSATAAGSPEAAMWRDNLGSPLGTLGGEAAYAMAANPSGLLVGYALDPDGVQRALVWRDGSRTPERLDPDDSTASVAVAVNDAGDISGSIAPSTSAMRAVVWRDGERILLPGFVDDMSGSYSITDAGVLGGYAADRSGRHRPVLWIPASAPTPAALAGASAAATPVSLATPVVVPSASPTPAPHPFVWDQVDVTVRLRQDGSFRVTERDRIAFSGGPFRSGYREIPLARIERVDDIWVGEVEGTSVTPYRFVAPEVFSRDVPNTYTWRDDGPILRIDWSFPETTSAARTFQIGFDAFGALRVYADADPPYQQISWIGVDDDLTATAPVNEATLTFILPRAIEPEQALLDGPGGTRPEDHTDDGQTWFWRASDLGAGESLTASLRFPPLVAADAPAWQEASDRAETAGTEIPAAITPRPSGTPAPQATPVAGPMDAPPCRTVMENDFPAKRRQLLADCTTDRPLFVPEAWVFDGDGHTIYARDPEGGRLSGGVVTVSGDGSTVRNVTVDGSGLTAPCLVDYGATSLAGVHVQGSGGEVTGVTVRNLIRALPAGSADDQSVMESCGEGITVEGPMAEAFVVENTIENAGLAGILINEGTASISNNRIDGVADVGILAINGANIRVSPGNRISNGKVGIQFEDRGTGGRIAGNRVASMSSAGIAVILGARAAVADNTVEDAFYGVAVQGDAAADITANAIRRSTDSGIFVANQETEAAIEENTIDSSLSDGIWVQDGAQASIQGNIVAGSARYGITAIGEGTRATIDGNTVSDAGLHGIWVGLSASADVSGNIVNDAAEDGILLFGGPNASISENRVTGGQRGIEASGAGTTATVANNVVEGVGVVGITINQGAAAPDVSGNTVSEARFGIVTLGAGTSSVVASNSVSDLSGSGFTVEDGAAAQLRGNNVSDANWGVIVTSAGTTADLSENRIERMSTGGISVNDGAAATVTDNTLVQPGTNGIEGDGAEQVHLEGNTIEGARGAGIRLERSRAASATGGSAELVSHDIYYEPSEVTIPAGTDVTLILPNEGVVPHNVTIEALGIDVDIAPGATEEVVVNAPAGTYEIYCGVPGHREAGQVAELLVAPGIRSVAVAEPREADVIRDNEISGGENGIVMFGPGVSASVTQNHVATTAGTGIAVAGGATATVENNTVDEVGLGIDVTGAETSAALSGNRIFDTTERGIFIQNGAEATVHKNFVTRAGTNGIVVNGRGTTATLTGNAVSDSAEAGITVESAASATIEDENRIIGGKWGINILSDGTKADVRGNRVSGATNQGIAVLYGASSMIVENAVHGSDSGIYVRYPRSRAIITGNSVTAEGQGIYVFDNATAERIADNFVAGSPSGIVIGGEGVHAVVEDNRVQGATREGIAVRNGATAVVTGNRVYWNGRGAGPRGIIVTGRSTAATVTSNEVADIDGIGIEVSSGADGTVRDNRIRDITNAGIFVHAAGASVTVSQNILQDAGRIGIEARQSDAAIRDNTVEGSLFAAIQLGTDLDAEVTGNTIVGPEEPGADDPGPYGVHTRSDARGIVAGNRISRVANPVSGNGCAILIDADAPDIHVADNQFPPPANDQDVCDERMAEPDATPEPAATPIAATQLPAGLLVPSATARENL